jgi:hypothetical protein
VGHIWDLNRECAPDEKEFYITGPGSKLFDKIHKNDFATQLEFQPDVSSIFDEQLMRDTWLMAYRMLIANPLVQSNPGAMYNLTDQTMDAINVRVELPKPEQANVISPMEKI